MTVSGAPSLCIYEHHSDPSSVASTQLPLTYPSKKRKPIQLPTMQHFELPWPGWLRTFISFSITSFAAPSWAKLMMDLLCSRASLHLSHLQVGRGDVSQRRPTHNKHLLQFSAQLVWETWGFTTVYSDLSSFVASDWISLGSLNLFVRSNIFSVLRFHHLRVIIDTARFLQFWFTTKAFKWLIFVLLFILCSNLNVRKKKEYDVVYF